MIKKIVIWSCVIGFLAALICLGPDRYESFVEDRSGEDMAIRGQYGDQYGMLNAIFSGLALTGLIFTLWFQGRDLRLQTKALRLQIVEFQEQKEEMARSAAAQERSNQLSSISLKLTPISLRVSVLTQWLASSENTDAKVRFEHEAETLLKQMEAILERELGK